MAEKLIQQHTGQGQLVFENNEAASVVYEIDEFHELVSDGFSGQLPALRSRRGKISHAEGHPDWHPITSLQPGPFTLVMNDGRKLKVFLRTAQGSVQATGDFF